MIVPAIAAALSAAAVRDRVPRPLSPAAPAALISAESPRPAELSALRAGSAAVRGVSALVGGGGKTTLLRTLGWELAEAGCRVLLCTTTRIYPFAGAGGIWDLTDPTEEDLVRALADRRPVCVGTFCPDTGKLAAPRIPLAHLAELADCVLVEADGSAGRPLKAHAPHEPVIPPEAERTICVVGASGFGRPIAQAAHRPELYARLAGVPADAPATAETAAAVLLAEGLGDLVLVNQVETAEARAQASALAAALPCPVLAGSLRRKEIYLCES